MFDPVPRRHVLDSSRDVPREAWRESLSGKGQPPTRMQCWACGGAPNGKETMRSALRHAKRVASAIESGRRRPNLNFNIHTEVAVCLENSKQMSLTGPKPRG
jgi:hypothetical protein